MSRLKSLFSEPCQRTATIHTNCSCMHKYIVRENLISFECIKESDTPYGCLVIGANILYTR